MSDSFGWRPSSASLRFLVLIRIFSACFDTSGSMIPRLVPEISPCDGFWDEQQELGILVVCRAHLMCDALHGTHRLSNEDSKPEVK